jgi:hypothetical protein
VVEDTFFLNEKEKKKKEREKRLAMTNRFGPFTFVWGYSNSDIQWGEAPLVLDFYCKRVTIPKLAIRHPV